MDILKDIAAAVANGDDAEMPAKTKAALAAGVAAADVLDHGLLAGMAAVGEQFRLHEIFLPDVLLAARALYAGLEVIQPLLAAAGVPSRGKVVIGTVQGDLHDIGKNLVAIMLKGAGFEVIDLGNDVRPEAFVAAAEAEGAKAIGMSALLTTTMPGMGRVIALLREKGLQEKIKTVIGGAPVSEQYAREIGADAYSYDAANAVITLQRLLAG